MATIQDARAEIMAALTDHFARGGQALPPMQIGEMTGWDGATVDDALRGLYAEGAIRATAAQQAGLVVMVLGVN